MTEIQNRVGKKCHGCAFLFSAYDEELGHNEQECINYTDKCANGEQWKKPKPRVRY